MKHATAIADAMTRAGFDAAQAELRQLAYAAIKKHHGNLDRALKTYEDSFKDDSVLITESHRISLAHFAEQILPDGGQSNVDTQRSSPTNRDGTGHCGLASNGPTVSARPARDTYLPGRTTRGLGSIISAQSTMRAGLLWTTKTSGGDPWGGVGWHELDGQDRDGAIARIIKRKHPRPANRFATLAELLTDQQFQQVIDEAKQQNDPA